MKEKANYPNTNKNKNKNKIYHFLAFRRKAKNDLNEFLYLIFAKKGIRHFGCCIIDCLAINCTVRIRHHDSNDKMQSANFSSCTPFISTLHTGPMIYKFSCWPKRCYSTVKAGINMLSGRYEAVDTSSTLQYFLSQSEIKQRTNCL